MSQWPDKDAKRALVTGVTGQDGSYLAELLLSRGYEVWGMVRRSSAANTWRIDHLSGGPSEGGGSLHLVHGDLGDGSSLTRLLAEIRPHEIYNLGAQSHVQVSFELPEYTADVTGLGALRLLESMRLADVDARFYQASSSELFGQVRETPQRETTPFHPRSPYAAAKAYAFHITRNYREAHSLFAVNGILFNHESPRRGDGFVTRKITRAVARIREGLQDKLLLGNLEARRDWGFAGDYVEAMWRMLQLEQPDDYVIATGESHSVREFCELAFARAGLSLRWQGEGLKEQGLGPDDRVLVEIDPKYFRPSEVDELVGNASKAQRDFGWQPEVSFTALVHLMVDSDLVALGGRQETGVVSGCR